MAQQLPLIARFPELASLPRCSLCNLPSPVDQVILDGTRIWIKRDDQNATEFGGNKARALEFLFGSIKPGTTILTLGGAGSTHALATAKYAEKLGCNTVVMRWQHDMNPTARRVAEMIDDISQTTHVSTFAVSAMIRAFLYRLSHRVHYIAAGGCDPLAALAQVNAALELVDQVRAGILPHPARIVLPLGTGTTAAGLALGFAIANFPTVVVGTQIAPVLAANRIRITRLINQTARLIEHLTGQAVPRPAPNNFLIVRDAYAGGYGRALPEAVVAADQLQRETNIRLDDTYSAKAFFVALELARSDVRPTLFWHTFDWRIL
jgi:D-cysteine desulfhydrase